MIKIGELSFETGAPNAERLLESTGQTIGAMRELLDGHLIAGTVARALSACIKAEHDINELACAIAAEGVAEVKLLVRELYEPKAEQPAPAPVQPPKPEPAEADPAPKPAQPSSERAPGEPKQQ